MIEVASTGGSPARDVTFLRSVPANLVVFGGIQLGLPFDVSVTVAIIFTLTPLVIGSLGSLLLFWLRSNDWMALLTSVVLANFATAAFVDIAFNNPVLIVFNNLMFLLMFFWFLVFPNGKLIPRWS
jgi:hypothetical protein